MKIENNLRSVERSELERKCIFCRNAFIYSECLMEYAVHADRFTCQ